jgi:hypothetical protein
MMRERHTTDTRPRRWSTAVAVAAVLTLTGCGSDVLDDPYEKPSPAVTADAAEVLKTLPTLEDTEQQITSAVEQIGAFVATLVPGKEWTWTRDRTSGGCLGRYGDTDGELVYSKNYLSKGPIPDEVWPAVFEQARTLAAAIGATEYETFHDDPGNHDIRFYSPEATFITVSSRGNAVITSSTGCRLPQANMPEARTPQPPVTPNP